MSSAISGAASAINANDIQSDQAGNLNLNA